MDVRVGDLEVTYSSRGNPTYRMEIWHDGLKKHRVIRGNDSSVVKRKAQLQIDEWTSRWAVAQEKESRRQSQEEQKQSATERTAEAMDVMARLEGTLQHTLDVNDAIDWEDLKDTARFAEPRPEKPASLEPSQPQALPSEPRREDGLFQPKIGLLDHLVPSRKRQKEQDAKKLFATAYEDWQCLRSSAVERNTAAEKAHKEASERQATEYREAVAAWERRKEDHERQRQASNQAIDRQRQLYEAVDPDAIVEYCDMVLSKSSYPEYMPKEFDLEYNAETKTLLVEYALPSVDDLPTLREVKYIRTKNELIEKHIPASQVAKLYDSVVYQVVLRTIHELYEADVISALDAVVFNGRVTSVDKGTGHKTTACILSLQATREEFLGINLAQVDPKVCFKSLRGVGSSKLHSLAPVAPILQMRREDGRFVSAREVANTVDESVNLAAMDWEDFEHLIRELFEHEFKVAGGEVSVTQASRDGGVDAVAFDPDPIRGGKIVIQAKRYTNTVGVAAVRDLYGTVVNEGANKGILVTTSDYGPDAYAFAKDKPLTLMNGANLLHLLEKHGHKARINIKEAREQRE